MERLRKLLFEDMMEFKFQPIISAANGDIFGYEALIRSAVPNLEGPLDIINLASEMSMLHELEKTVQLNLLKTYKNNAEVFKNKYLFFNSLPAETIDKDIYEFMSKEYSDILSNIVIEISECEQHSAESIALKSQFIKDNSGKMAFDNYGAGFAGDDAIFSFAPDFIKLDICIITYLDQNDECGDFLKDFVKKAHANNIKLIALGIERSAQMEKAIKLGVDYLQGFYITHPSFEIISKMDEDLITQILEANS